MVRIGTLFTVIYRILVLVMLSLVLYFSVANNNRNQDYDKVMLHIVTIFPQFFQNIR